MFFKSIKITTNKNNKWSHLVKSKELEISKLPVEIKGGVFCMGSCFARNIRKTLEKDLLNNYKNLFEQYFLKSLTSRLTDYSSNKFEVLDPTPFSKLRSDNKYS